MLWLESDFVVQIIQNNIGPEILDLLNQVKERASKFSNSPSAMTPSSPCDSPPSSPTSSPSSRSVGATADSVVVKGVDLDDEKIVRKLVF